jgi:hypothetical protein
VITERISASSKEYVKVPIVPPEGVDPSSDAVTFYFSPSDVNPTATGSVTCATNTGILKTTDTSGAPHYTARCLIGPAANVVAAGVYYVFVKITDSPTIPVKRADGQLEVY